MSQIGKRAGAHNPLTHIRDMTYMEVFMCGAATNIAESEVKYRVTEYQKLIFGNKLKITSVECKMKLNL